eukprot:806404-Pleurochrysis_carterae.AAC.1
MPKLGGERFRSCEKSDSEAGPSARLYSLDAPSSLRAYLYELKNADELLIPSRPRQTYWQSSCYILPAWPLCQPRSVCYDAWARRDFIALTNQGSI